MENETGNAHNREEMLVIYYFTDALKHYVKHQNEIYESLPEQRKPKSLNIIPLELLQGLIEGLSGEKVGYEATLRGTIHNAKASSKWLKLAGIFYCAPCGAKDIVPLEVKNSRDGMTYIKNGQFNYEMYREYEKTEEVVSLNFRVPENLAPDCRCEGKGQDDFLHARTSFGVHLSDKDIKDLQELNDKKTKIEKQDGE